MIEYFEVELKNQSRKLMDRVYQGLRLFGGQIHATHESKYFTGKLAWRNPVILKVSLPVGLRWQFISETKIWLARPGKVTINPGMPEPRYTRPICFAAADHDSMPLRREYHLGMDPRVIDHHPVHGDRITKGLTKEILDGKLDVLDE